MYNLQTNKQTSLLILPLLFIYLSLYSVNLHAKQIDVEINAGCQPVVTALMVFPAIRLGASAQFLWASSVTVGLESNVQVHVCDNVEEALEDH